MAVKITAMKTRNVNSFITSQKKDTACGMLPVVTLAKHGYAQ